MSHHKSYADITTAEQAEIDQQEDEREAYKERDIFSLLTNDILNY